MEFTCVTQPAAIIAIGASAGGVDALRTSVVGLLAALDAAVFLTLHIGAQKSELPWLLNQLGSMSVSHATQRERIRAGHIFVAPPDHRMTIERGRVCLTKGLRKHGESRDRPDVS